MALLHVSIAFNGRDLTFEGDGDQTVVVAAFRAWLASPICAIDDQPETAIDVPAQPTACVRDVDVIDVEAHELVGAAEAVAAVADSVADAPRATRDARPRFWRPSPDSQTWGDILTALAGASEPLTADDLRKFVGVDGVPTYLIEMRERGAIVRDTRTQPFRYSLPGGPTAAAPPPVRSHAVTSGSSSAAQLALKLRTEFPIGDLCIEDVHRLALAYFPTIKLPSVRAVLSDLVQLGALETAGRSGRTVWRRAQVHA